MLRRIRQYFTAKRNQKAEDLEKKIMSEENFKSFIRNNKQKIIDLAE